MANYRTFGRLDDAHVSDGDRGFQRMISRVNPELLEAGNVYYSQNGRMDKDFTWEPRQGMTIFQQSIQTEAIDTILPFVLDDSGTPPILNDNALTGVYGTGYFVDLSTDIEYIIIALNNRAIAKPTDGSDALYNIAYEDNIRIFGGIEFTMVNDKIILFRDNEIALEFNTDLASNLPITSATATGSAVTFTTSVAHGLSVSDDIGIFNVTGLTGWSDGTYVVQSPITSTTFSVTSLASAATVAQTIAIATTNSFTKVANGAYTAISVDNDVSMDVADGVCTVSLVGHSRSTGDILQIYDGGESGLLQGDRYEVKVGDIDGNNTADKYHFLANIPDGTGFVISLGGKQPVSGGFIHMPNPGWGVEHEGRLIVPYRRSTSIGENIDELVFSDIFDTDTYDPIINQLRFGSGSADQIVGVSPFISDRLLVFCKNSVHVVNGIAGDLEDLTKFEVTREVGCVARKSITPVGNQILWLSDQGIYSVSYGGELNLMANNVPLSDPIEPFIRSINWEQASKAIGIYHNNRYYLAAPYKNSNDNNVIFVYNFLNKGWESIDTMPNNFYIKNMVTARYKGKNQLFVINDSGAVHRYESAQFGNSDSYSLANSTSSYISPIAGKMVTRRYTFGTNEIKKFAKATSVLENKNKTAEFAPVDDTVSLPSNSTIKISANLKEPDNLVQLGELDYPTGYTIDSDEDTIIKSNINYRGYGMQFVYETSNTKIRSCQTDAFILGRNTIIRS